MILLSKNISNTSSSSSSTSSGLSNEAIITITIFILLACCFLSSAVYLLIKGKNISDIFEETIEDDDCGSCIGFMNDSRHSDNNNNNILQDTKFLELQRNIEVPNIHKSITITANNAYTTTSPTATTTTSSLTTTKNIITNNTNTNNTTIRTFSE